MDSPDLFRSLTALNLLGAGEGINCSVSHQRIGFLKACSYYSLKFHKKNPKVYSLRSHLVGSGLDISTPSVSDAAYVK